jgi:capsular polysaccharide biosynthesis protein
MAGEQRAERLSLIEPASLPDHPNWPNRPLMIAAGTIAGIFLGLIAVLIVELLKGAVRSPVQIEGLGLPVIGIVPLFDEPRPKRRKLFGRREPELA